MSHSNVIFNYDYVMGENKKKGQQRKDSVLRSNLGKYIKKDKIEDVRNALGYSDCSLVDVSVDDMKFLLSKFIGYSEDSPENIDKFLMHWSSPPNTVRWPKVDKLKYLYNYFVEDVPLYLDVNQFLKSMMLSSNLLFKSSNLKLCLAVMVDRFKIGHEWDAQEIIDACQGFVDTSKFTKENIEACLNKYCKKNDGTTASYVLFEKKENGKYLLKLTELIACYNDFLKEIHAEAVET